MIFVPRRERHQAIPRRSSPCGEDWRRAEPTSFLLTVLDWAVSLTCYGVMIAISRNTRPHRLEKSSGHQLWARGAHRRNRGGTVDDPRIHCGAPPGPSTLASTFIDTGRCLRYGGAASAWLAQLKRRAPKEKRSSWPPRARGGGGPAALSPPTLPRGYNEQNLTAFIEDSLGPWQSLHGLRSISSSSTARPPDVYYRPEGPLKQLGPPEGEAGKIRHYGGQRGSAWRKRSRPSKYPGRPRKTVQIIFNCFPRATCVSVSSTKAEAPSKWAFLARVPPLSQRPCSAGKAHPRFANSPATIIASSIAHGEAFDVGETFSGSRLRDRPWPRVEELRALVPAGTSQCRKFALRWIPDVRRRQPCGGSPEASAPAQVAEETAPPSDLPALSPIPPCKTARRRLRKKTSAH